MLICGGLSVGIVGEEFGECSFIVGDKVIKSSFAGDGVQVKGGQEDL